MTIGEKNLLRMLQNYRYDKERLKEAVERLEGMSYKVTPSYSSTGGSGGRPGSKVEDYTEKAEKLRRAIRTYRQNTGMVDRALESTELDRMERRVLEWIACGGRLSSLAEAEGIYISRIYKIRDKALRKALRHLETQNEVDGRVKG